MKERIIEIVKAIKPVKVLADVGCDHGYVTKLAISENKSEKYIISDVSEKCLNKAKKLLAEEIDGGKVTGVVSDGFKGIEFCDEAVIAGMGGEEIISILTNSSFHPQTLVLQPMKNSPKLRRFLIENGYKIITDYTFSCGRKFYDLIVAEIGEDTLSPEEEEFGRTNIEVRGKAFTDDLKIKIKKLSGYIKRDNISESERERLKGIRDRLKNYV